MRMLGLLLGPSESPPVRAGSPIVTSCSACGTGSVRSTSASMSVKVDVFAPMPSASVSSTTAVNPAFCRMVRSAYAMSCRRLLR